MGFTVGQLAALVQGAVHGAADTAVSGAAILQEAGPAQVSFLENDRHLRLLKGCRAAAVVVPAGLLPRLTEAGVLPEPPPALVAVADPLLAFVTIVQQLQRRPPEASPVLDPRAVIDPTAVLGPGCGVGPFAVVGPGCVLGARCRLGAGVVLGRGCRLGDDVVLHAHVVLYDGTVLGHRVQVHANAVLGADGFGYRFDAGKHRKVPQLGSVEVEDDVEIGACTTIDRGTFAATRIAAGTKIDNLVMIGHNCRIGPHNLIAGQAGFAGSTTTGSHVVVAGQVGLADHLTIGDGAQLGARSGLHQDVPPGERVLGTPARPLREARHILLSLNHLPGMVRDVRRILAHLGLPADGAARDEGQERKAS